MKYTYELGLTDRQTGNKLVLRVKAESGAEAVDGVAGVLIPADGTNCDGGETCYKLRYCRAHDPRLARALAGEPQRIP